MRGYKEYGTTTTPFDMAVLNDLDRFHLAIDVIDRLPHLGERGGVVKGYFEQQLVEHNRYIRHYGEDLPAIRDWHWTRATL